MKQTGGQELGPPCFSSLNGGARKGPTRLRNQFKARKTHGLRRACTSGQSNTGIQAGIAALSEYMSQRHRRWERCLLGRNLPIVAKVVSAESNSRLRVRPDRVPALLHLRKEALYGYLEFVPEKID
jgi:hypothetical protein